VKGLLPLAISGSPEQQRIGARELKLVMIRYLEPLEKAFALDQSSTSDQATPKISDV
jgi:hypothetical protein